MAAGICWMIAMSSWMYWQIISCSVEFLYGFGVMCFTNSRLRECSFRRVWVMNCWIVLAREMLRLWERMWCCGCVSASEVLCLMKSL